MLSFEFTDLQYSCLLDCFCADEVNYFTSFVVAQRGSKHSLLFWYARPFDVAFKYSIGVYWPEIFQKCEYYTYSGEVILYHQPLGCVLIVLASLAASFVIVPLENLFGISDHPVPISVCRCVSILNKFSVCCLFLRTIDLFLIFFLRFELSSLYISS